MSGPRSDRLAPHVEGSDDFRAGYRSGYDDGVRARSETPTLDTCDAILREVCESHGIDPHHLIQTERASRRELLVKGEAVYRMRERKASWPVIARTMFYCHHQAAMHAMRAFTGE